MIKARPARRVQMTLYSQTHVKESHSASWQYDRKRMSPSESKKAQSLHLDLSHGQYDSTPAIAALFLVTFDVKAGYDRRKPFQKRIRLSKLQVYDSMAALKLRSSVTLGLRLARRAHTFDSETRSGCGVPVVAFRITQYTRGSYVRVYDLRHWGHN